MALGSTSTANLTRTRAQKHRYKIFRAGFDVKDTGCFCSGLHLDLHQQTNTQIALAVLPIFSITTPSLHPRAVCAEAVNIIQLPPPSGFHLSRNPFWSFQTSSLPFPEPWEWLQQAAGTLCSPLQSTAALFRLTLSFHNTATPESGDLLESKNEQEKEKELSSPSAHLCCRCWMTEQAALACYVRSASLCHALSSSQRQ